MNSHLSLELSTQFFQCNDIKPSTQLDQVHAPQSPPTPLELTVPTAPLENGEEHSLFKVIEIFFCINQYLPELSGLQLGSTSQLGRAFYEKYCHSRLNPLGLKYLELRTEWDAIWVFWNYPAFVQDCYVPRLRRGREYLKNFCGPVTLQKIWDSELTIAEVENEWCSFLEDLKTKSSNSQWMQCHSLNKWQRFALRHSCLGVRKYVFDGSLAPADSYEAFGQLGAFFDNEYVQHYLDNGDLIPQQISGLSKEQIDRLKLSWARRYFKEKRLTMEEIFTLPQLIFDALKKPALQQLIEKNIVKIAQLANASGAQLYRLPRCAELIAHEKISVEDALNTAIPLPQLLARAHNNVCHAPNP